MSIVTMTMRRLLPSVLAVGVHMHMCACKPPVAKKQERRMSGTTSTPSPDTMIPNPDTILTNEITSWSRFEDYTGRYAGEVDLLEKEPLKERFRELLGRDTLVFIQRFQVAPPIEVDDGILYNDGCKPHNCSSDEASLAIDMNRDIIYAGVAINGKVKLYAEDKDTSYPQRLIEWKQKFGRR
jgi:hypothetical protein